MCSRYETKLYDGEVPFLDLWGMSSSTSLPFLQNPLVRVVIASDTVPSMFDNSAVWKQMIDL